ncbi:hypothetical protein Tco_0980526 [Tanacetum coccineum]
MKCLNTTTAIPEVTTGIHQKSSSQPEGETEFVILEAKSTTAPRKLFIPEFQAVGPSFLTPKSADKGKGIAIDLEDSPPKLVKALNKVRQDPNPQPELIDYQLPTGKMTKLTHDEVAELLERDGKIKN